MTGFLNAASSGPLRQQIAAFHEGLKEAGYVEGQNVAVEYRWAEGQYDRLPALAADLVRRQVSVIVAGGGAPAVLAAKAATTAIPIVFSAGADPVGLDLVASLNRPGGNITGVYHFATGLEAKRLGLLHEMVPQTTTIAVLVNPNYSEAENQLRDVQEAAAPPGRTTRCRACQCGKRFRCRVLDRRPTAVWGTPGLCIPILQH